MSNLGSAKAPRIRSNLLDFAVLLWFILFVLQISDSNLESKNVKRCSGAILQSMILMRLLVLWKKNKQKLSNSSFSAFMFKYAANKSTSQ